VGSLNGRVVIVTGAGRGLGREHALLLASEGATVVVNDLGSASDGSGKDTSAASSVVAEIEATGGAASVSDHDISDWKAAEDLVRSTVEQHGALHALVNNAGILRDRQLVNMAEEEWDAVVRVHLRGHAAPTRVAAAYWKEQAKQGNDLKPCIVNTSSVSGLIGNFGQTNYGAAKAGIAAMTTIEQLEFERFGVRVNAIAPAARTRLTGGDEGVMAQTDPTFDYWAPGNVSPTVAYLARAECPMKGRVFYVAGGEVHLFQPWTMIDKIEKRGRWEVDELTTAMEKLLEHDVWPPKLPEL
jgi:NAD(P)-dependent dehydrogenase (short-subunit alcohol dehydrogenase family)